MTRRPVTKMHASSLAMLRKACELDRADRQDEALLAFGTFLDAEPRHAGAWASYGGLLMVKGRFDEAAEACQTALKIDPKHLPAMVNLASTFLRLNRREEALDLNRRALILDPRNVDALVSLAVCLQASGDLGAARTTLERLLSIQSAHQSVLLGLSNICHLQKDWRALRTYMERQLDGFKGPEKEYERSFLSLLFGELPKGWAQHEARLQVPGRILPLRHFIEPKWRGEPFQGQTLLVHWEQGMGDTLMFVRYLPMVKALGGTVILMVQPALVELVATCAGADRVIPEGGSLPPFDLQISLMSLPAVFQTDLQTIPAEVPYLGVPAGVPNRTRLAEVLAPSKGGVRIGVVWAGSPAHKKDAERSLPAEALGVLGGLPGAFWHSFQLGRTELPPLPGLVSLAPLLSTFSDTAYALSAMDLVITVDTALAHLAGAMGIPTLLLLPFQPDFRWLFQREDSPWYPTLRIYRQSSPGDWESVIQNVFADLGRDQADPGTREEGEGR